MNEMTKPVVKLIGQDGNAFAIMAVCRRVARDVGWTDKRWKQVRNEMTSGDYNHLLRVAMKYFEVE